MLDLLVLFLLLLESLLLTFNGPLFEDDLGELVALVEAHLPDLLSAHLHDVHLFLDPLLPQSDSLSHLEQSFVLLQGIIAVEPSSLVC